MIIGGFHQNVQPGQASLFEQHRRIAAPRRGLTQEKDNNAPFFLKKLFKRGCGGQVFDRHLYGKHHNFRFGLPTSFVKFELVSLQLELIFIIYFVCFSTSFWWIFVWSCSFFFLLVLVFPEIIKLCQFYAGIGGQVYER